MKDDKAKEITAKLYDAYASDTGVLFGIPAECRNGIEAIVKAILLELE